MLRSTSVVDESVTLRFGHADALNPFERVALISLVGIVVVFDVIAWLTMPEGRATDAVLGIIATLAFLLYLRSAGWATVIIGIVFALSFTVGREVELLIVLAVATGLVLRLGRALLVFAFLGCFLVATALVAYGGRGEAINLAIYLVVAVLAGAIGLALRAASARGRRLEFELAERAEQERQAVLAERRWIAGELHDSIAHHLTVVSLHVQLLDDAQLRSSSQEAIRIAAKKAMTDLRFVIDLADDGPRAAGMQTGDLSAAIEEARGEFEAAGHPVRCEGDPLDERLPRGAEIVFARIVRESATNILKHAGPGEVAIAIGFEDHAVDLEVRSPLPAAPRRDLPSSGTGLNRMAERVIGASGEFSAGPQGHEWVVHVSLPIV